MRPPLGHVIYGVFPDIIKAEAGILQREWINKYGPVVRAIGPFGIERLIFMRPDALHKVLVSDWIDYPRPGFMRSTLGLTAGWGLLTVTGNEHKQMRKAMNPAFSMASLMAQMDMYHEPIESLIRSLNLQIDSAEQLNEGVILSMYDWMSKVTLDIICKTAFGYDTNSLHDPHNELAEAYERLISLQSGTNLARFIAILVIPGVPRLLESDWVYRHRHWFSHVKDLGAHRVFSSYSMHRIKNISAQILKERMRDAVGAVSDMQAKRDVMSLLVRARQTPSEDKELYTMSDQSMMEQVTLWLLANDKESQTQLRDEVQPILAKNPRPDYRSLKELRWLDCVV
ncbi:hypothetical protein H0H93_016201 [Arthromyces matolae]|nr:hypothetical protein H0H93_016201 [Arthromyces matolae]